MKFHIVIYKHKAQYINKRKFINLKSIKNRPFFKILHHCTSYIKKCVFFDP